MSWNPLIKSCMASMFIATSTGACMMEEMPGDETVVETEAGLAVPGITINPAQKWRAPALLPAKRGLNTALAFSTPRLDLYRNTK